MSLGLAEYGLLLMCVLMYILTSGKILFTLKSQKIYMIAVALTIILSVLNVCVLHLTSNIGFVITSEIILLVRIYLMLLFIIQYLICVYLLSDIARSYEIKHMIMTNRVIFTLTVGISLFLSIFIEKKDGHLCISGVGPSVIYVVGMYFAISALIYVFVNQKDIRFQKCNAVAVWTLLWIGISVSQFVLHNAVDTGFVITISMFTIFISLENPLSKLDKQTDSKNIYAFVDYIDSLCMRKKDYYMLVVQMTDDAYSNRAFNHIMKRYYRTKAIKVFKDVGYDVYFVCEGTYDKIMIKSLYETIKNILKKYDSSAHFVSFDMPNDVMGKDVLSYISMCTSNEGRNLYDLIHIPKDRYETIKTYNLVKKKIIEAIDDDRVDIYLQPIYSVKAKQFVSAEVLCRIINPDGSIMMPGEFINVAESSGLILELEDIIFEKVCKFIYEQNLKSMGIDYLEVNLSVVKGESEAVRAHYRMILAKYDIDPSMINLEITESASILNKQMLLSNMSRFKSLGFNFALDDFGSGESNLNYVMDMPVSLVKFDKDIIQRYFVDEKAKVVVSSTVNMIHNLGLCIIGEGIETREQLNEMVDLGIDYIQGYYFSKPLSKQDFVSFISNNKAVNV